MSNPVSVDVESYVIDVIRLIGQYLEEKSVTRKNPADNTGCEYENDVFLISAYDWRDDQDIPEGYRIPNFWYKPINYQVEWYKHVGRGTYGNRPMPIDDAFTMFRRVIDSLQDAAAIVESSPHDFWEDESEG